MESKFSFTALEKELDEAKEEGITFEDKQLKWNSADDVKDVVEALDNAKLVHYLKLEGNTLGVDAAAAIGKALEKHSEFRKALWRNMFTGRLKAEIPLALKHLGEGLMTAAAQLTVLDLSDNALGPNGMRGGLEALLRSKVCYSLQELCLNNCGLGIGGGRMLSAALLDCHRTSTEAGTPLKLKVFIAGRNRLENDGAKAIAKIFATVKTLEEIAMPQNSIYHEGIAALANGFKENPKLRVVNLNDNTVRSKGATALADAFALLPRLQTINFGDCLLKTNGAYIFAEALQEGHSELEEVDLGFNEINVDGCVALVQAMAKKNLLKSFNIDGNAFGPEGAKVIQEAALEMAKPTALKEFTEIAEDDDVDEIYQDNDSADSTVGSTVEECEEEGEDSDNPDYLYGDDGRIYSDDDDEEEDAAYTTTSAFSTNLFGSNETTTLNKSFVSAEADSSTGDDDLKECSPVQSFCLNTKAVDLATFNALECEDKLQAFLDVIKLFEKDEHLLIFVFTTLKCAHLAKESPEALKLSKELFGALFKFAADSDQELRVAKYLLLQLDMMPNMKISNSSYNKESCRYALQEYLNENKKPDDIVHKVFNNYLKVAAFK